MEPVVYILASSPRGILHVGVTSDLLRRAYENRNRMTGGFTDRHHVHRLVYFERHDSIVEAIAREKRLKRWRRVWKERLIERVNPEWRDLYADLL